MSSTESTIQEFTDQRYKHGFVTEIETDTIAPGLDEEVIRSISARKNEPQWLTDWTHGGATPEQWRDNYCMISFGQCGLITIEQRK